MLASDAMRERYSREISGSSVRVRMWSTLRAPLSTSVQRLRDLGHERVVVA